MSPFILIVHGPMCAGKSTVIKLLLPRYKGLFRASSDQIKWLVSDWNVERANSKATGHNGKRVVDDLVFCFADIAIARGFSIVVDAPPMFRPGQWHDRYRELSQRRCVDFFQINIEAPFPVLSKRFAERVKEAELGKRRSVITDPARMADSYRTYMSYRDPTVETLDSSVLSPEEIVAVIEKKIFC